MTHFTCGHTKAEHGGRISNVGWCDVCDGYQPVLVASLTHEQEQACLALLHRAYDLLSDVGQPPKTVKQAEVQKWLEDVEPYLKK